MKFVLLLTQAVLSQQLTGPILRDFLRKKVADRKELAQFRMDLPPDQMNEKGHADLVRDRLSVYNGKWTEEQ